MKQRLDFIDISKAIGIILVVLGHVLETGAVHDFIYSFHMPLFFIICGFTRTWICLGLKDFGIEIKKNIERYVVPYFILMLIAGPLSLSNIKNYVLVNRNITYLYPMHAKWFLPCFFVSICIAITLYQIVGRITSKKFYGMAVIGVTIALLVSGFYFNGARCGDEILWLANIALMGCAFIYVGILLRIVYDRFYKSMNKGHSLGILLVMAALCFLSYKRNNVFGGFVAMVAGDYGIWYWFILGALSGTIGIMLISVLFSKFLQRGGGLIYLGQNSMIIMMFHSLFINQSKNIFSHVPVASLFETVFCIIVCILVIELVNRYLPSLAGRYQRSDKRLSEK